MSDQTLFGFARMTPGEYRDDCEQQRLPLETPKGKATTMVKPEAFCVVPCPSCGGSTFDDGTRPIVCHCGATIPGEE
jgi:hypothetical protein